MRVLLKVGGAGSAIPTLQSSEWAMREPTHRLDAGPRVAAPSTKLGADVQGWKVGDRALVALILSCGQCRECLAGRDNQCETVSPRDSLAPLSPGIGVDGGMADYIAVGGRITSIRWAISTSSRRRPWPTRPSHRSTRSTPSATVSPATRPPWSRPRRTRPHGVADPAGDHRLAHHRPGH